MLNFYGGKLARPATAKPLLTAISWNYVLLRLGQSATLGMEIIL